MIQDHRKVSLNNEKEENALLNIIILNVGHKITNTFLRLLNMMHNNF